VLSFVEIEGNVAPEDCFLSRQIVDHPSDDAERFFEDFIARTREAPAYASALYAASLKHKVRAGAVTGIFRFMVQLSDYGALMNKFLALRMPRMFMHGEHNGALTYLPLLRANGVQVDAVPECGHFPMYSNPVHMWRAMAEFIASHCEAC
jgi:pimeloyl-ACP methyl ester carboxylesterase